ncbi:hypothetical protein JCM10212_002300 [Sporobolomyces blumeae]
MQGAAKTAAGGSSVRGRTKHEQDQQRKTVYRPVLDNPLTISWPPLPAQTRRTILDLLLPLFAASPGRNQPQSVADWRAQQHAARRGNGVAKGKDQAKREGKGKGKAEATREPEESTADERTATEARANEARAAREGEVRATTHPVKSRTRTYDIPSRPGPRATDEAKAVPVPLEPAPRVLDHVAVGINEVTRALETRIRWARWELGDATAAPGGTAAFESTHVPTGTIASSSSREGRSRKRKKTDATAFSARATADSARVVDYSSLPGYGFLASGSSAPVLRHGAVPPYYLASSNPERGPRLLANSESLRLPRRATESKDRKVEPTGLNPDRTITQKKRRSVQARTVQARAFERDLQGLDSVSRGSGAEPDSIEKDCALDASSAVPEPSDAPYDVASAFSVPIIDLVFVCKPEINPPTLVAHLPAMAAAANGVQTALDTVLATSAQSAEAGATRDGDGAMNVDDPAPGHEDETETRPEMGKVFVVPLDVGAEKQVADALGLRRVAAVGLSSSAPGAGPLVSFIHQHLQPLSAPWLVPHVLSHPRPASSSSSAQPSSPASATASTFVPTHIKHLKTSAPLNPKAAHQARKDAKKFKREERLRGTKRTRETDVYVAED